MGGLEKISARLNGALMWIGGACLIGMICLTCANIFLRLIWKPVSGTFELMGYMGAITAAFALGYTQIRKGHIAVDVLIDLFSQRTRNVLHGINSIACFLFMSLCCWQVAKKATILLRTGEVTETLRIVYYPFVYAVAVGCGVLALVFATDLLGVLFLKKDGDA